MNRFCIHHLLLLLAMFFAACSNEDALPDSPDTPEEPTSFYRKALSYNTLYTEEKLDSDAQTVTAKQTFSCTDGLLTQMVYEQSLTAVEPISISHTSDICYQGDKVIITDSNGCTNTYQLNAQGYAESCEREENGVVKRRYSFYYDETGLSAIEEFLPNDNFETAYSRIVIAYYPDMIKFTHKVDQYFQTFAGIFNTNVPENSLAIPNPFLAELHPLSMHTAALYAHILGDIPPYFMQKIMPIENEDSQETMTFYYNFDEAGIPTDCIIQTESYGETFNRKISYQVD